MRLRIALMLVWAIAPAVAAGQEPVFVDRAAGVTLEEAVRLALERPALPAGAGDRLVRARRGARLGALGHGWSLVAENTAVDFRCSFGILRVGHLWSTDES